MTADIPVLDIIVGERSRKSLAQILALGESIRRVGLLHPVVINSRNELIAGGRRLAAVKSLGWDRVPVRVVHSLDEAVAALRAEMDENTCREQLSPTEIVELGRRIEAIERPAAKDRQRAGGGGTGSGKLPEPSPQTRDRVAEAMGTSGRTYVKAKAVVDAAAQQPETLGDLPKQMDATGKVDPAHREMKKRLGEVPSVDSYRNKALAFGREIDRLARLADEYSRDPAFSKGYWLGIKAKLEAIQKSMLPQT